MIRPIAFCAGLVLAWCGTAEAQSPLCFNHHPVKRSAYVTYGGLPRKPGYQRDHLCPLGLGCPDIISNVRYQRCFQTGFRGTCLAGPAADKDHDEHAAIEHMCSRDAWPPPMARHWLAARWPVDAMHGYDQ